MFEVYMYYVEMLAFEFYHKQKQYTVVERWNIPLFTGKYGILNVSNLKANVREICNKLHICQKKKKTC